MTDPIIFERLIDATPAEAFALFTEPERLRRWQAVSASVDLRVGGEYRFTEVPGSVAAGTFTEIDPGRRVVYTWDWVEGNATPPGDSTIVIEIEPTDDERTLVRLSHAGLSAEAAAGHSEGWEHYMDRLEAVARSGEAGLDPWAVRAESFDALSAAEASWAICRQIMLPFTSDDRELATPCSEFTVHDLVEHLMGSMRGLGDMAGAEIPESIDASSAEDYIARAAEPALRAWRARGLDGNVGFGKGEMPAAMAAGILGLEFLIHAWDFAQATGQKVEAPETLVEFVQGLAETIIQPDNRGEGKGFDEPVTVSSEDPLTRLMAFSGRAT